MTTDELLTKKKQAFVSKRKPQIIRGTKLAPNAAIEDRYYREMQSLILQMTRTTRRRVLQLFKSETATEFFAMDESVSAQAKLITNQLTKKFVQLFSAEAQGMAEGFLKDSDRASSGALHESLKALSGGLSLKTTVLTGELREVISASITENVGLIKSIPQKYMAEMQGAVMRSITSGRGLQDLVPFFDRYEKITTRRARLIASDQTRKVYSALNAGRMEKLNLDKYEWLHSGGGVEPRRLHLHLAGKICSLKNPPVIQYAKGAQPEVRGKPGDLPGCKCTMRPVIDFGTEKGEK